MAWASMKTVRRTDNFKILFLNKKLRVLIFALTFAGMLVWAQDSPLGASFAEPDVTAVLKAFITMHW